MESLYGSGNSNNITRWWCEIRWINSWSNVRFPEGSTTYNATNWIGTSLWLRIYNFWGIGHILFILLSFIRNRSASYSHIIFIFRSFDLKTFCCLNERISYFLMKIFMYFSLFLLFICAKRFQHFCFDYFSFPSIH